MTINEFVEFVGITASALRHYDNKGIAGSLASSSLVSHIAVQKYMNAMPLYRMEKGFAYDGVTISRQNMANWVIACSLNYLVAIICF